MKEIIFPKPKPQQEAYNSMLKSGFERYPKRYENYKKYLSSKRDTRLKYMPVRIDIEPNNECNLQCDMCLASEFSWDRRTRELKFEDFKKIIDEQYGLIEVKIQGLGEPFLCKDFIDMVFYAKSKDIWTRTATNATLLDKDKNFKNIIDAGIGEIQVSIDGATKETYEKIRVNSTFEKVVRNCKLLNSYCDTLGVDKTRMWVLLQKDNFKELNFFPAFAKELGFRKLTISIDVNGWADENWIEKNKGKNVSHKVTQTRINALLNKAKDLDIDLTFWDISTKYTKQNLCPWPFERIYISTDMKIVPCCMVANPQTFNLGDARNLIKEWNSPNIVSFRKMHLEGDIPDICKSCYKDT